MSTSQKRNLGSILEPGRPIPVSHEADLLVCGGGTAGTTAAICAARLGLRVVMVEMSAQPGGMSNQLTWLNDFDTKGGFPREWLRHLEEIGAYQRPHYTPFAVTPFLDKLLRQSGVRPLYLATAARPILDGNRVIGAFIESKSGRSAIRASVVLDATGDGDLAARAGAPFRMGRESDGACQAISLTTLLGNWSGRDLTAAETAAAARAAGSLAGIDYELPYDHWHAKAMVGQPDLCSCAVPHVSGHDPTDVDSLSDALIELRRQASELASVLGRHASFAGISLGPLAGMPGVRESRRIETDRVITTADVLNGTHCDDGLFLVTQNIDIHRPAAGEPAIAISRVNPYHLPYAAMLPRGLEQILVAGRCIGGDHEAAASYRIMADCMAMGEAAAIAAHQAVRTGLPLRRIDVQALRREMAARGYAQ